MRKLRIDVDDHDEVRIIDCDTGYAVPSSYAIDLIGDIKKTIKRDKLRSDTNIKDSSEWTFDPQTIGQNSYGGNRPCVYFATHHARPGMVKIGYTGNSLAGRMRSMAWTLDRDNLVSPQVIAYAETWEYKEFEKALHFKFADWRITGEWFDGEIVRQYLEEINPNGK